MSELDVVRESDVADPDVDREYLLIASTGGHLAELVGLSDRLDPPAARRTWMSFDAPQTDSLLADRTVVRIPNVVGRTNPIGVVKLFRTAWKFLRAHPEAHVVSTGAGIALPFIVVARALGREAHYIECAARQNAPSITGRLLRFVPGAKLYAQHQAWAGGRWLYRGSILDGFERTDDVEPTARAIQRVVVTVGMNPKPFTAVINRLREVIPGDVDVTWQVGSTPISADFPEARSMVPTHELHAALRKADLVIAHAGIGSSFDALEAGHVPVLIPRAFSRDEHLDDHQQELAVELANRGLAVTLELEDLDWARLADAAGKRVVPATMLPPFKLSH